MSSVGTANKVIGVESARPPITARARGRCSSLPAPIPRASGSKPNRVHSVVIRIGGSRTRAAYRIILLDFTRPRMQTEPVAPEVAIREAARGRPRPTLMTTLCTPFRLPPLPLGIGAGSELQRPLALAVIGGLALSTPITLFAVPTLLIAIRGAHYRLQEAS